MKELSALLLFYIILSDHLKVATVPGLYFGRLAIPWPLTAVCLCNTGRFLGSSSTSNKPGNPKLLKYCQRDVKPNKNKPDLIDPQNRNDYIQVLYSSLFLCSGTEMDSKIVNSLET